MSTLCAISNKQIQYGDEVVAIMLTKIKDSPIRGLNVYSWDLFSPVNILLSAVWQHGLTELSLYKDQSVNPSTIKNANSMFFKHIEKLTDSKKKY